MDPFEFIECFYPGDTPLRKLLVRHSTQVRDKALSIMENPVCSRLSLNREIVSCGAMLHDIGIRFCHAPDILCEGDEPYLTHGVIGARLLRELARPDLEIYARICERHTGTGITAEEIRSRSLPLPERDFLPETLEEKLICLADKFYSKSGDMQEKSMGRIHRSILKFGPEPVKRWESLCLLFGV